MEESAPIVGQAKISDDLTDTKVILDEMIAAHKTGKLKSRERALVITKLEEARMWVLQAQLTDGV